MLLIYYFGKQVEQIGKKMLFPMKNPIKINKCQNQISRPCRSAFHQRNYTLQICYLQTAFHLQASVYYLVTYSSRKTNVTSTPSHTGHSVQQFLAKKQILALNTQKLT